MGLGGDKERCRSVAQELAGLAPDARSA
jgi:hypothetical protein